MAKRRRLQANGTTDPHAHPVHIDRKLLLELTGLLTAMRYPHMPAVDRFIDIPIQDRDRPSFEWCVEFAIRSFFGSIGYEGGGRNESGLRPGGVGQDPNESSDPS